jgi:hypothetical protein
VAEQARPVARKGRTLSSERLVWGLDSPSVDWWGRLGRKRLPRRSAARRVAVGRRGRNAGEQAGRRPMHVHERIQGVQVEANVVLELEEGRRTVGRTGELRPTATAGTAGRLGAAPERMRGRRGGALGGLICAHAR